MANSAIPSALTCNRPATTWTATNISRGAYIIRSLPRAPTDSDTSAAVDEPNSHLDLRGCIRSLVAVRASA